jgi:hypothetical protein
MEKYLVTINKRLLQKLIEDRDKLRALENAGVDNWDGYDFAMENMMETEVIEINAEGDVICQQRSQ